MKKFSLIVATFLALISLISAPAANGVSLITPAKPRIVPMRTVSSCSQSGVTLISAAQVVQAVQSTGYYLISSPGVYCLTGNIEIDTNGAGFVIDGDNITFDLQGYQILEIGGSEARAGGLTRTVGIDIRAVRDVAVKNGKIVGFDSGINYFGSSAMDSKRVTIEKMIISHTYWAIFLAYANQFTIRNSVLEKSAFGVNVGISQDVSVLDNKIKVPPQDDVLALPQPRIAVNIATSDRVKITGNKIVADDTSDAGARGINLARVMDSELTNNFLSGFDTAVQLSETHQIVVENNSVKRPEVGMSTGFSGRFAIDHMDAVNTILYGNTVRGYGIGFRFRGQSSGKIEENKLCQVRIGFDFQNSYLSPLLNGFILGQNNQVNAPSC